MDSNTLLAFAIAFLCGSIPFGLLLTRAAGLGDVRQIGSGSIGATNVLRTGNKGLAAATVLLDAAKGTLPVLLAAHYWPGTEGVAAVGAVAGHCFTPWLRFKGGKGFATAAGALLAIFRISSVASLATVVTAPLVAWALGSSSVAWPLIAIAAIVIFQHRTNIGRLMRGEEPRVGQKR